jgi:spermidine/putrescine transport system ATP-binding protein
MSDRVAVMRAGRLEQVGTPEEIYEAPESAFVARFIGSANLVPVVVERVDGGRAAIALPGGRRGSVATGGHAFEPGTNAVLMIRPERIDVTVDEPPADRLAMPVTCTDVVFQGPVRRIQLRDPDGGELIDFVEAARPEPGVVPGATLWATWEPEAARLLQPER